jgi:hypothetical protein
VVRDSGGQDRGLRKRVVLRDQRSAGHVDVVLPGSWQPVGRHVDDQGTVDVVGAQERWTVRYPLANNAEQPAGERRIVRGGEYGGARDPEVVDIAAEEVAVQNDDLRDRLAVQHDVS